MTDEEFHYNFKMSFINWSYNRRCWAHVCDDLVDEGNLKCERKFGDFEDKQTWGPHDGDVE